jgi:hypothetical protein
MKRKKFAPQLLSLLAFAVSISSFGQTGDYAAISKNNPINNATADAAIPAPAPLAVAATAEVEEGFSKWYPQATNPRWTRLEKGFQASFLDADRKTIAVFNNNGKFSYAIAELSATQLPTELTAFIKKEYPGHQLLQAVTIRDNSKTIYQTILQQGPDYIRIKSIGEDMEVSAFKNRPAP